MGLLKKVEKFLDTVRRFYKGRGYTEVVTPYLLPFPNLDENVYPIPCKVGDLTKTEKRFFLHTSPEYSMKKLLATYKRDIFQICHVFRNYEEGRFHDTEFLMLEYYKVGKDYTYLIEELEELIKTLFGKEISYKGKTVETTFERLTLKEAFKRYLGIELNLESKEVFKRELQRVGIHFEPDEDLETLFFRAYVELEKHLGFERPTVIYQYPEPFGALARCENGFCERFELYIFGIELANGYTEINDPKEVEKRLSETAKRLNLPIDRTFVEIHKSLPDLYSGVSVGLDRLMVLKFDLNSIWELYYRKVKLK